MAQYVEVGKDVIEFPDGMPDDQIAAAIKRGASSAPDASWAARASASPVLKTAKTVADAVLPPTGGYPFQGVADAIIPRDPTKPTLPGQIWEQAKTPSGAGAIIGTAAPVVLDLIPATKPIGAAINNTAGRSLGGGIGAGVGAIIEGRDPLPEAGKVAGSNLLAEALMLGGEKVVRSLPTMKGRIAERQAQGVAGAIRQVSPELADVVEGSKSTLAPTLRGPKTGAAMQSTALTDSGQKALSAAFERGMVEVERLAPNATVMGPALLDAYSAMPQIARDRLIGPVAVNGFTPRQAQEVIAWAGSRAFTQSPLGQGVGQVPQQMLWKDALTETVTGLRAASPDAADMFVGIRAPYGAGQTYLDMLRSGTPEGPFRGFPNKIMMDENLVRRFISENRQEVMDKLGPAGFKALNDALGGAQPGTKSLLTPGAGGPFDALMATFGRGTNTGTMSAPSGALRVPLANVGSQYTGRAPYSLPTPIKALMDILTNQSVGAATRER